MNPEKVLVSFSDLEETVFTKKRRGCEKELPKKTQSILKMLRFKYPEATIIFGNVKHFVAERKMEMDSKTTLFLSKSVREKSTVSRVCKAEIKSFASEFNKKLPDFYLRKN